MYETTDRLSALAGPSTLQSLIDTITKGVVDKFSSILPKKNGENASKNVKVDSDEELANHMSKLSINKAISKQVKKEIKKTSQHRCSGCHIIGHHSNSPKCPKNKKKSQSRKKGSVNKISIDSNSDTNNSFSNDSESDSETGSDAENSSSESESESDVKVHITKAKKK